MPDIENGKNNATKQQAFAPDPKWRMCFGIREKLIGIFVVIKVLPLGALAFFAARQITPLGNTFKDKSDEMVENTRNLVSETGALATESSITALDLKSRENIERLATDIAAAVAEFLYDRDKILSRLPNFPLPKLPIGIPLHSR